LREAFRTVFILIMPLCAAGTCPASADSGAPAPPAGAASKEAEALKQEELAVVQALARDFPGRVEPIILMGNVQHRLGRTDEAMKLWQQALKRDPKHPEVYEKMGWFAMEKGQYQEAIAHWQKALEIAPDTAGVHSGMARALMGLNEHREAITHLEEEIKISPQSSFDYFLLGQEHMQVEQYEQARASYEKAIAVDPNLTNAYYGLFTVCVRLGQRDEAKEHMATFKRLKAQDMETLKDRNEAFDDLIDMRKDAAETMMLAGQAYQANGKLARAEQLQYRAAALDPHNAMYHLHCGALSMQMGRLAQAEKAFRQVITLAPDSSRGYSGLAHLYLQANQKLPQARQLAEKAVALEPSAFNHYVLAWARDRNGDRSGAIVSIRRALELEPNNQRFRRIAELMEKRN
jgi:tetratricopeptide (TPR) repeat protein